MVEGKSKKNEIRNVVLYARVSTAEQAERDLSLPAQVGFITKKSSERGYRMLREFVEPGASGTDDNRKVFRQMLEFVLTPSNDVQAILVYQTSRFMRNATKARALKDQLRRRGIRVIALAQETTDDPMGHIIEGIFELIDQYESEANGLRTAAAMRENARQGYHSGARPPFGFRVERTEVKPGLFRGKLVPDAQEAPLVREVLRLYIGDWGAKGVAEDLNRRGLRNRGRLWRKDMVIKVVDETAAIGTFYWGKHPKKGVPTDEEEWVAVPCEPIVDRELFETAQRVRAQRDPKTHPGRITSSRAILIGLLRCSKCGKGYQVETSGKPTKTGEVYRYYNCRSTFRMGKSVCPGSRFRVEVLEKAVLEHVADKLFTPERCRSILRDLVEQTGVLRQKTMEQRLQFERELEDVERRIQKWELAFEAGELPKDVGVDRVQVLKQRRSEIMESLRKVVPMHPPPAHLYGDEAISKFRKAIRDVFLSGENALTRHYLRFLIER